MLATLVAFIGVLSVLLSSCWTSSEAFACGVGLTGRQLWQLVSLETGLMGVVAGLLAMPTGLVLALILIYIINRRSFGWTLATAAHAGALRAGADGSRGGRVVGRSLSRLPHDADGRGGTEMRFE